MITLTWSPAFQAGGSVKTTAVGGVRGYDGAKKVGGRKRHLLVETQGLVLLAKVHDAAIQDRAGAPLLLKDAAKQFLSQAPLAWTAGMYDVRKVTDRARAAC